jgi:hypothetical protein
MVFLNTTKQLERLLLGSAAGLNAFKSSSSCVVIVSFLVQRTWVLIANKLG